MVPDGDYIREISLTPLMNTNKRSSLATQFVPYTTTPGKVFGEKKMQGHF